ncbi:MAG: DUF3299 domain-containing protein [Bacteroidota bacterium]
MRTLLIFLFSLWTVSVFGQIPTEWTDLSKVRFVSAVDFSTGNVYNLPRFPLAIKRLDGKEIEISGYMLPLDMEGDTYAFSRYPYAACFFCGGAGLESVMSIWFAKPDQRFRLDQFVKLRGVLRLQDKGGDLIYLLDQAKEVE